MNPVAVARVSVLPVTACVICGRTALFQVGSGRGNRACAGHVGDLVQIIMDDDGWLPVTVALVGAS